MLKKKNNSGFTSTQILLVIIVIVGIVGVVFSSRLLSQSGKAFNAEAAGEIEKIGIALDTYAKDNGDYPSTDQGITALGEARNCAYASQLERAIPRNTDYRGSLG